MRLPLPFTCSGFHAASLQRGRAAGRVTFRGTVADSLEEGFEVVLLLRLNLYEEKNAQIPLHRVKLARDPSGSKPIRVMTYCTAPSVCT